MKADVKDKSSPHRERRAFFLVHDIQPLLVTAPLPIPEQYLESRVHVALRIRPGK
jgi:hypothetical protein